MKRAPNARTTPQKEPKAKPAPVAPAAKAKAAGGQRRTKTNRSDWWTELRPKLIEYLRGLYATPGEMSAKSNKAKGIANAKKLARTKGSASVKGIALDEGIPNVEELADGFRPGYAALIHLGGRVEGVRVLFGPDDGRSTRLCFVPRCELPEEHDYPKKLEELRSYIKKHPEHPEKEFYKFLEQRSIDRSKQWHRFAQMTFRAPDRLYKADLRISFSAEFFSPDLSDARRTSLKKRGLWCKSENQPCPEFEALDSYLAILKGRHVLATSGTQYTPLILADKADLMVPTKIRLKQGELIKRMKLAAKSSKKKAGTRIRPKKLSAVFDLREAILQNLYEHFPNIGSRPRTTANALNTERNRWLKMSANADEHSRVRMLKSDQFYRDWEARDLASPLSRKMFDAAQRLAQRNLAPPCSIDLREACGRDLKKGDGSWTRDLSLRGLRWLLAPKKDRLRADVRMLFARVAFMDHNRRDPSKRELRIHFDQGHDASSDRNFPSLLKSAASLFELAGLTPTLQKHRGGSPVSPPP